jgi:hypothetical protein
MKARSVPGRADEELPKISLASSSIISKPWKENKVAHSWMIENEEDTLFDVRVHVFFMSSICSSQF